MGSTTNRNLASGVIQQLHGLLQDRIFWIDYSDRKGSVCIGTFQELGKALDRPYKVPSPIGIDFRYNLDREDGTKVMRWNADGTETAVFEFATRREALAKLESIWQTEIGDHETGCLWFWKLEDAQAELDEWRRQEFDD